MKERLKDKMRLEHILAAIDRLLNYAGSLSREELESDVLRNETEIEIKGRHDPCIAQRALPVVEAAAALTALDVLLCDGMF